MFVQIARFSAGPRRVGALTLALVFSASAEIALPPPTTNSPAPAVSKLSLVEARRVAFLRNWDILAAKSDVDIATAQSIVSHEYPNPTASLSTAKISVDDHPSSTVMGNGFWERSYDTIAAINQQVEIGGKRRARQQSTDAGLRGAGARLADTRRILNAGVTQAYVGVLLAERKRQILLDSAASLRQEAKIAEARQQAGEISLADKAQIEIAAQRLDLDAQAAEADAHKARVDLEVLLGEKTPQGKIQLADELEPLAEPPSLTKNSTAFARRPDIIAAESARTKAEADLRLQKAMRIPDPTFLAQYEHEPPDQPNTVGFGVSFPLPLWNRNRGNIKSAEATLDQTADQLEKISAQAVAEIATAQTSYDFALSRWQSYRDELTPKSRQVRETVVFAYQKGGASLLDLLSAQRNDNDVRLATAQAAADTASAAAALRAALNAPEK